MDPAMGFVKYVFKDKLAGSYSLKVLSERLVKF